LRFDRLDNLPKIKADPHGFHDQLLDLLLKKALAIYGARGRQIRHDGAEPGPRYEESLLDQVLYHLLSCIGVDLQIGRERPHRREGLSGLKFSAHESLLRGVDDLIEDGLAGLQSAPELCHIDNVTHADWNSQAVSLVPSGLVWILSTSIVDPYR
jgi:hypothetical protein